jgi:hypothetical protein
VSDYRRHVRASHVNAGTALPRTGLAGRAGGRPVAQLPRLHTEVDTRVSVTAMGGLALVLDLWRNLGLTALIDQSVTVLKRHVPYHESDHVLAQVLNLYRGGTCIEDQAHIQHDPAILRMAGANRLPDPTTAGDFLRRFDHESNPGAIDALRTCIDKAQTRVLKRLKKQKHTVMGDWGVVDVDSHVAPFYARQKQRADFSYNGQWSYHPLLVTLANTSDVLAVRNRPGNASSAAGAEDLLDDVLPRVGEVFGHVLVRADSAFDRQHLRRICDRHGAHFATVARQSGLRPKSAYAVEEDDWKPYVPPAQRRPPPGTARQKGVDERDRQALRRGYNRRVKRAIWVTETIVAGRGGEPDHRLIIMRELLQDQTPKGPDVLLFELHEFRYIVTNLPATCSTSQVVDLVYDRSDQENIIEQLKNGVEMWAMPTREFDANSAFLEIGRLAWSLGKWLALLALPLEVFRWEWKRFRSAYLYIPAVVITQARQVRVRFYSSRHLVQILSAHAFLSG